MDASGENVEYYFFNHEPLLTKEWEYAIIVEVEDDQKTGRVSAVWNDGKEIGTLVSHSPKRGTIMAGSRDERSCGLSNDVLMQELKRYLPKHLQILEGLELAGILGQV